MTKKQIETEMEEVRAKLDEAESRQQGQEDEGEYYDDVIEPLERRLAELKSMLAQK